jgi:hypothetical protein
VAKGKSKAEGRGKKAEGKEKEEGVSVLHITKDTPIEVSFLYNIVFCHLRIYSSGEVSYDRSNN